MPLPARPVLARRAARAAAWLLLALAVLLGHGLLLHAAAGAPACRAGSASAVAGRWQPLRVRMLSPPPPRRCSRPWPNPPSRRRARPAAPKPPARPAVVAPQGVPVPVPRTALHRPAAAELPVYATRLPDPAASALPAAARPGTGVRATCTGSATATTTSCGWTWTGRAGRRRARPAAGRSTPTAWRRCAMPNCAVRVNSVPSTSSARRRASPSPARRRCIRCRRVRRTG